MERAFYNMKILITGGSGFIGTNCVEYFANKNFEVLNIDIKPPQNSKHKNLWYKCDILDFDRFRNKVIEFNPNYFLHLAARTDLKENTNIEGYAANIEGVTNTIEILRLCKSIQKVIFASSRMVCKIGYIPINENDYCPPNLYGESKIFGEQLVKKSDLRCDWIIVRPTSIWGPWFDIPYKIFFTTISDRLYFHPGKFNPSKSFGYVNNTVYQLDKLFQTNVNLKSKIIYLCDYPPLKLKTWAELIKKEMNIKSIPTIPYQLLKIFAYLGDVLNYFGWYRVPLTSFRLNNLITNMTYDTKILQDICGKLPYSLEDGVKKTVEWIRR